MQEAVSCFRELIHKVAHEHSEIQAIQTLLWPVYVGIEPLEEVKEREQRVIRISS